MNTRLFYCSLIIGFLFVIFDMLIGIITSPLLFIFSSLTIWKNPPDIIAGIIFDFINGFILVGTFHVVYDGIPYKGWKKGTIYGAIIGLFRVVMGVFSTYVMYEIPLIIIFVHLITSYVEIVILGILVSILHEKLDVGVKNNKTT